MTADLLPCPFCGGESYLRDDASHSTAYFVGCSTEDCFGEIHWGQTADEAIAAWNRRAALPARGVGVLEWEEQAGKSYRQANCVLGQYQVSWLAEFECWQLSRPPKPGQPWKDGFSRHSHKDEAKAAAQADYEARILSALAPQPARLMENEMGDIGSSACPICMGRKRVMVGMSFPPKKTIAVKYEYDPCPNCQPGPHSFHARRTMQILVEMRERREARALEQEGRDGGGMHMAGWHMQVLGADAGQA